MSFPLLSISVVYEQSNNSKAKRFYRLIFCFDFFRSYILIDDLPKYSRKLGVGKLKGISNKRQKYEIQSSLDKLEFQEKINWIAERITRDKFHWSIFINISRNNYYIVWSFSNKIIATEFALLF